jgi:hypothetical protein
MLGRAQQRVVIHHQVESIALGGVPIQLKYLIAYLQTCFGCRALGIDGVNQYVFPEWLSDETEQRTIHVAGIEKRVGIVEFVHQNINCRQHGADALCFVNLLARLGSQPGPIQTLQRLVVIIFFNVLWHDIQNVAHILALESQVIAGCGRQREKAAQRLTATANREHEPQARKNIATLP